MTGATVNPQNAGQAPSWREFDAAGYRSELIPIRPGEKGCYLDDWQNRDTRGLRLSHAARYGQDWRDAEIGLRTRDFPAIDLDIDDEKLAAIAVRAIMRALPGLASAPIFARDRCDDAGDRTTPRRALILARDPASQPWAKKSLLFEDPITKTRAAIEILADGQQIRVNGKHPSGDRYRSPNPVPRADKILKVGPDDMNRVLDELVRALTGPGAMLKLLKDSRKSAASSQGGRQTRTSVQPLAETAEPVLRELVMTHMPNTDQEFPDYEDAVRVCSAIWGASGGTDWGREIWEDWAASYDGAPNEDAWIEKRWSSMSGGTRLGWGHLVHTARSIADKIPDPDQKARAMSAIGRLSITGQLARDGDDTPPLDEVGVVRTGDLPERVQHVASHQTGTMQRENILEQRLANAAAQEPPSREMILSDPLNVLVQNGTRPDACTPMTCQGLPDLNRALVYVIEEQTYLARASAGVIGAGEPAMRSAFPASVKADADAWAAMNHVGKGKPPAGSILEWVQSTDAALRVSCRGYWPGAPEVYTGDRNEIVWNTWAPPKGLLDAIRTPDPNADPDLGDLGLLVRGIVNDGELKPSRESELILDWLAWAICAPGVKPGWHPMICGGQGLGKSSIAETVRKLVGPRNYTQIGSHAFQTDFNDWAETQFALVEEAKGLGGAGRSSAAQSDTYNNIKVLLAPIPDTIRINPKYGKVRIAANRACVMILTNHSTQALALDPDDRRLMVVESTLTRNCPEYIQHLRPALGRLMRDRETPAGRAALWHGAVARMGAIIGDPARRDAILGDAPMTPAKRMVIQATMGPLPTLISELVEDGTLSGAYTVEEIRQAILDVSAARRVPRGISETAGSNNALVNVLKELGFARPLSGEGKIRCKDGQRRRLWMAPTRDVLLAPETRATFNRVWALAGKDAWAHAWAEQGVAGMSELPGSAPSDQTEQAAENQTKENTP